MDHVLLLDKDGKIIHHSLPGYEQAYGTYLWDHYPNSAHVVAAQQAFASARAFGRRFAAEVDVRLAYSGEEYSSIIAVTSIPESASLCGGAIVQDCRVPAAVRQLTARERVVTELTARGMSTDEVAGMLSISSATVATHRARARQKLGIDHHADLSDIGRRLLWLKDCEEAGRLKY